MSKKGRHRTGRAAKKARRRHEDRAQIGQTLSAARRYVVTVYAKRLMIDSRLFPWRSDAACQWGK